MSVSCARSCGRDICLRWRIRVLLLLLLLLLLRPVVPPVFIFLQFSFFSRVKNVSHVLLSFLNSFQTFFIFHNFCILKTFFNFSFFHCFFVSVLHFFDIQFFQFFIFSLVHVFIYHFFRCRALSSRILCFGFHLLISHLAGLMGIPSEVVGSYSKNQTPPWVKQFFLGKRQET